MMKLTIVLVAMLFAAVALSAPDGTRDRPAKFTVGDAIRTPKHHQPHLDGGESEGKTAEVREAAAGGVEDGGEVESSGAKRERRSLKLISEAIHGKPESKLIAIPLTHGAKKASSSVKAVDLLGATGGFLGLSGALSALPPLGPVPVIAAVVKAKLAAPLVKPLVVKAHFGGKALVHKMHTVEKIMDHKMSKLRRHF